MWLITSAKLRPTRMPIRKGGRLWSPSGDGPRLKQGYLTPFNYWKRLVLGVPDHNCVVYRPAARAG